MSQLTSSELDQVCTSALDFVRKDDAVKQVACKTLTLPTAVSGGTDACKTAYNQCLASDAGISIPDAGTTNGSASGCSVPALCTATVGDYQNCVTDVRKQLDTLNSEFKVCDLNSAVNLDGAVAAQPASCTALDEKCPGILQTAVPSTTP